MPRSWVVALTFAVLSQTVPDVGHASGQADDPNAPPPVPSCSRPIWPNFARPLQPSPRVDTLTIDGVRVNVLLPPEYRNNDRRYPVLYLLHGGAQWQDLYLVHTDIEAFTAALPDDEQAIVVMPDGAFGVYQDTRDGSPSWERFHLFRVLPYVDSHYRTIPDRAHRAITGESGGGLGTMAYATRHPDLFVAASSMSGVLDISPTGGYPFAGLSLYAAALAIATACDDAGDDPMHTWGGPDDYELWQRNENPTDLAGNLGGISVRVASGNGVPCDLDDVGDYPELFPFLEPIVLFDARHFTAALDAAGVAYTSEFPDCGIHSFRYFQRFLHDFWPQMIAAFGTPPPTSFDYRRADAAFTVWDWTFIADPGRAGEFLDVADASCQGVGLTGSGTADVTTGACFPPGETVRLSGAVEPNATADSDGRISFHVNLGPPHDQQQYTPVAQVLEAAGGYFTSRTVAFAPIP